MMLIIESKDFVSQVWFVAQNIDTALFSCYGRCSHQGLIGQPCLILQLEKSSFHLFLGSLCLLPHLFFPCQNLALHLDEAKQII